MKVNLSKIFTKGKAMYLAYDQGLEHGPVEFNDKNIDPKYIIDIAKQGYNAIIFQKGIAEKYQDEIKESRIPLIIKLNGKTNLLKGEPVSRQLCSVKEAIKLGASAVGYTIYIGSFYESVMLKEFETIEEEAHAKGIPVIAWIYPRGKSLKGKTESELMEYAARVGLEIGADIVKLKYSGNPRALQKAVKAAGRCKLVVAGGIKTSPIAFFNQAKQVMKSGAAGMAVGRNIWQSKNPDLITRKLKGIIFS